MPSECGCRIRSSSEPGDRVSTYRIDYCALHAAAPALRDALEMYEEEDADESRRLAAKGLDGHAAHWWVHHSMPLRRAVRAALARASGGRKEEG